MNVSSYIIDNSNNKITDKIIAADIIGEYSNEIILGGDYDNTNVDSEININISDSIIDNIETCEEVVGGLLTKTNESECINGCDICSSKQTIKLMSKFINNIKPTVSNTKDEDIVKQAEKILKCDSESCVLVNSEFNNFVKEEVGNTNILKYELLKNFKTKGPRNNTDLLSNFNIDETLIRWSREFKDFYPCPFSMIDFNYVKNNFYNTDLSNIFSGKASFKDPINGINNGPFKTYGCVLNTDVSTGRGKHWVCIFVDGRSNNWTIEYFNSSGNPPCPDVNEWMETQRKKLLGLNNNVETITVTNIVHQKSNTECGMYVLYYIRSRLDGISYQHFLSKRIEDADVTKFRKHVFRKY